MTIWTIDQGSKEDRFSRVTGPRATGKHSQVDLRSHPGEEDKCAKFSFWPFGQGSSDERVSRVDRPQGTGEHSPVDIRTYRGEEQSAGTIGSLEESFRPDVEKKRGYGVHSQPSQHPSYYSKHPGYGPKKSTWQFKCLKEVLITSAITAVVTALLVIGSLALYNHFSS